MLSLGSSVSVAHGFHELEESKSFISGGARLHVMHNLIFSSDAPGITYSGRVYLENNYMPIH